VNTDLCPNIRSLVKNYLVGALLISFSACPSRVGGPGQCVLTGTGLQLKSTLISCLASGEEGTFMAACPHLNSEHIIPYSDNDMSFSVKKTCILLEVIICSTVHRR